MKVSILDSHVGEGGVECKANKCDAEAKNGDVSNILEELLSPHVETRVEDDRRQKEVKEEVLLKLVDFGSLVTKG